MARVKLSEYKAKQLLFNELNQDFSAVSVTSDNSSSINTLSKDKQYVVKVDQGIKGRGKKGLVSLKVTRDKIQETINQFKKKGYSQFIIEEMIPHQQNEEKYLSLERTREGIKVLFSKKGGVEIEEMKDNVKIEVFRYKDTSYKIQDTKVAKELDVSEEFIQALREFFDKYYVSFLEINPLVVESHNQKSRQFHKGFLDSVRDDREIYVLDLAVEVDSVAQFFVKNAWDENDIVVDQHKTEAEKAIKELNDNSQAALSFTVLNKDGLLWVLLSGGGASITLADEAYNLGFGKELGNYGEYSGNPNEEETFLYTDRVIGQMLQSSRRRLMLIIGGGVANFTDVRVTFKGILKALEKNKEKLKKRGIKVFVRRGGPHQESGLRMMEEWLQVNGMYGLVRGPELPLHEIIREATKELKNANPPNGRTK